MKRPMVERQVFVTWYTPEEKMPPEDVFVPVTMSGKCGNIKFDHALVMAEWDKTEGWYIEPYGVDSRGEWFTVHAWCDLEPYGGKR